MIPLVLAVNTATTSRGTAAKLFVMTPLQHIHSGGESANGTMCWLHVTHT